MKGNPRMKIAERRWGNRRIIYRWDEANGRLRAEVLYSFQGNSGTVETVAVDIFESSPGLDDPEAAKHRMTRKGERFWFGCDEVRELAVSFDFEIGGIAIRDGDREVTVRRGVTVAQLRAWKPPKKVKPMSDRPGQPAMSLYIPPLF